MNSYYSKNKEKLIRNDKDWGKIISKEERELLSLIDQPEKIEVFDIPAADDQLNDEDFRKQLINAIKNLVMGKALKVIAHKEIEEAQTSSWLGGVIASLKPGAIRSKISRFYPFIDAKNILWQLISEDQLINDYYIREEEEHWEITVI